MESYSTTEKDKLPNIEGHVKGFYLNYHINETKLGGILLLEKIEEPSNLTFILEDKGYTAEYQEVWSYEKWKGKVCYVTKEGKYYNYQKGEIRTVYMRIYMGKGLKYDPKIQDSITIENLVERQSREENFIKVPVKVKKNINGKTTYKEKYISIF